MNKAIIKIAYRQVIDTAEQETLSKHIFNVTYNEFLLKSQAYNIDEKFKTFSEIKAADGRANSLHYKIAFAAQPYIELMNKKMPGLCNSLGQSVSFDNHTFELIESNVNNITSHKIAITYYTHELLLLEIIGEFLLLSEELNAASDEYQKTFMIRMQQNISIISYKKLLLKL